MPVATPTELGTGSSNSTASSIATSSLSPSANALVVAVAFSRGATAFSAFSSAFSTGGWTTLGGDTSYGSNDVKCLIGWAITTGSPGTGAVTATWGAGVNSPRVGVYEVATGYDATTPIAQFKNAGTATTVTTDSDFTGTFDSAPASTSVLICGICSSPNNIDHDALTGWTEFATAMLGGSLPSIVSYDSGSTSTTFGGTILYVDQTAGVVSSAVEIQESSSSGVSIPVVRHHMNILMGQ